MSNLLSLLGVGNQTQNPALQNENILQALLNPPQGVDPQAGLIPPLMGSHPNLNPFAGTPPIAGNHPTGGTGSIMDLLFNQSNKAVPPTNNLTGGGSLLPTLGASPQAVAPQVVNQPNAAQGNLDALVKKHLPKMDFGLNQQIMDKVIQGQATPKEVKKVQRNIFDNPEMRDLMTGVGVGLLQGKSTGDALAQGIAFKMRGASNRAASANSAIRQKGKAALDASVIGLNNAKTIASLADARKSALGVGGTAKDIKNFSSIYKAESATVLPGSPTYQATFNTLDKIAASNPGSSFVSNLRRITIDKLVKGAMNQGSQEANKAALNQLGIDYPSVDFTSALAAYTRG